MTNRPNEDEVHKEKEDLGRPMNLYTKGTITVFDPLVPVDVIVYGSKMNTVKKMLLWPISSSEQTRVSV